jgi:predicted porin
LVDGAFKDKHVTQVAAAYDFGVARALFTFQDNGNLASDRDTAYVLGVTAPVGPGVLWGQYGVAEAAGTDSKIISLGYKYLLSKRTTVYAQYGNRNVSAAGFSAANAVKTSGYGFGMQHNF